MRLSDNNLKKIPVNPIIFFVYTKFNDTFDLERFLVSNECYFHYKVIYPVKGNRPFVWNLRFISKRHIMWLIFKGFWRIFEYSNFKLKVLVIQHTEVCVKLKLLYKSSFSGNVILRSKREHHYDYYLKEFHSVWQ